MRLKNMKGWSSRSINSALNDIRRKMNSPAAIKGVRRVRDYEEFRDLSDERQRMEEEELKAQEYTEESIEITEERIEGTICTHSDLK